MISLGRLNVPAVATFSQWTMCSEWQPCERQSRAPFFVGAPLQMDIIHTPWNAVWWVIASSQWLL